MKRMYRFVLSLALALALGVGGAFAAQSGPSPAGTLSIKSQTLALGVGVDWGEGMLTLNNGERYRFSLEGLEVGSVGITEVQAVGEVYNLEKASDFEGVYVAAKADVAVIRGPGARTMRNTHGVVIHLSSVQEGVKLALAAEGVKIDLVRR